ncbi:hypothetical protein PTNB85_07941 [Pyrenophora teres f. teres]|uniref:Uncharacterized protein n=1 Tax=Pyrenophora teres f. teres TaxID=97479 RepID=A0A6S6WEM1_9PLEO|nr:hypothetical protein PTNB85_07941 [Pyrenophora teres f. teres]KAE8829915.1 hypothetical protein HRS9139_06539 [Pyrenophora teres f. teres]CAE7200216.1 hypothetical protein PTTW11_08608 [Pyrenophora teres f. teres]
MTHGLSITSAPLLFFSKLRNKTNPYAQHHHPINHSHSCSHAEPATCHAPAHADLLAQAREAAGRDAVTGRRVSGRMGGESQTQAQMQAKSQTQTQTQQGEGEGEVGQIQTQTLSQTPSQAWKAEGRVKQEENELSRQEAEEQKKAYLAWVAQNPQMRGSPYGSYEEFVREKVERRGLVGRGLEERAWVRGEFYAPAPGFG